MYLASLPDGISFSNSSFVIVIVPFSTMSEAKSKYEIGLLLSSSSIRVFMGYDDD